MAPNAKKALLIVGISCLVVTIAAFIYMFAIPSPILQKEIDKWKFAQFTDTVTGKTTDFGENMCPTFGSYPIFLDVQLTDHKRMENGKDNPHQKMSNKAEFSQAITFWNKIAKEEGLGGKLFEPYSPELVASYKANLKNMATLERWKDLGKPREWPIVVKVLPYGKENYKPGGCEFYSFGQKMYFPEMLAALHLSPPELGYLQSPTIKVCEKSYSQGVGHNEYGMGILKNEAAQQLRYFRLKGIGIHETGHLIFGTGRESKSGWTPRGHAPAGVGAVMDEKPTLTVLSRHMRALFRQRVVKPCKASGLVFTK